MDTLHDRPADEPVHPEGRPSRRGRRWRRVATVVALLVLAAGIASVPGVRRGIIDPAGRDPVRGVTEVEVRDDVWEYFAFTPSVIEVPQGTTVTWSSTSRAAHNVVFTTPAGERVASPLLDAGDQWSHTFEQPGELAYTCTLHEGMDGRVLVTGSG